jgi:hypothetical protein
MKALEVTPSEIKEAALGHSMTKLKVMPLKQRAVTHI